MKIITFSNSEWSKKSSNLIINYIKNLKNSKVNMCLTGGESASKVYNYFFPKLFKIKKFFFSYLSDERCVSDNSINSNFFLLKNKLKNKKTLNLKIFPILNRSKDFVKAAEQYKKKIPNKIDMLLLSIGKDGHIASIFEKDKVTNSTKKKIVYIKKKYNGFSRITITWEVIKLAKKIFILCAGYKRGKALYSSMIKKKHILSRIFLFLPRVELCLDKSAYLGFKEASKKLLESNRI